MRTSRPVAARSTAAARANPSRLPRLPAPAPSLRLSRLPSPIRPIGCVRNTPRSPRIAAQAARLGVTVDAADAMRKGISADALRRSVLDALAVARRGDQRHRGGAFHACRQATARSCGAPRSAPRRRAA